MPDDRLLRVLSRLHSGGGREPVTNRLCVVCAEMTAMSGAGIMLIADDRPQGSVCTTDAVSALIEELQFTLGEGPCIDAHRQHRAVGEPDLADPAATRWAAFTAAAFDAGARAVFGFPLEVGPVGVGALNLYRDQPGPLTADQQADAVILAGVAARAIVATQAGAVPGEIGADLEAGADFRFVVHQAAGMVSVQLTVAVDEALIRLRAHAFRHDRSVAEVARDVIERRLRFGGPDGDATSQ
jgi:GAF domain-containing protein